MSTTKHNHGHHANDQGGADTNALAAVENNSGVIPDVGTVIFDSTGETYAHSETLFGGGQNGQAFSNPDLLLSDTLSDLQLQLRDATPLDGGTLTVTLWSSFLNSPLAQIATLGTISDSLLSASPTLIDLTLASTPTLNPLTQYWIEVNGNILSHAQWDVAGTLGGTGDALQYSEQNGVVGADLVQGEFMMSVSTTCYAAGTHILTARGDMTVESLLPGDRVVALRRGGLAEVRWVGHREVNLRAHPAPERVNPVRIMAGAFAPGVPHRDLVVSPDHALFVNGMLVTARYLINGATIVQESPERVTYYHVELDAHDVLLAEGLAAESYLDVGNRGAFQNGGRTVMVHPDFARETWDGEACAPSMHLVEQRAPVRAQLLARAYALGYGTTGESDLHVVAGGQVIWPEMTADGARFTLQPGIERVQVVSRSAVPRDIGAEKEDGRRLGVGVTAIRLDDARVALDDPRLLGGWHKAEQGLRWTSGDAVIATGGARVLTLGLHGGLQYWAEIDAPGVLRAVG
jgi:hypothetical protein